MLYADVSEHFRLHTYLPMKMEQSDPKRRRIKFRRRGISQKKAYITQLISDYLSRNVNFRSRIPFFWDVIFCIWVTGTRRFEIP